MSISRSIERAEVDLKPTAECQSQTIYQSEHPPNRPIVPSEGQQWENCQVQGLPCPCNLGITCKPFSFSFHPHPCPPPLKICFSLNSWFIVWIVMGWAGLLGVGYIFINEEKKALTV